MLTQITIAVLTSLISFFSCTPEEAHKKPIEPKEVYKDCCGTKPVEWTKDNGIYLFIPNAFTPNGDGVNDIFYPIVEDDDFEYFTMVVYAGNWDTSGVQLFLSDWIKKKDADKMGWNGTYNDGRPYKGLFTYLIKYYNTKGPEYHFGIEGQACAIDCVDAEEFAEKQGCFYPVQAVKGRLDKSKGHGEKACFE